MLKHLSILVVISFIIMLTVSYCFIGLQGLLAIHRWIISVLNNIFAGGEAAVLIKDLLALLAIPLGITLLAGGIFWGFKRTTMPYLPHLLWAIWLILVTALIFQHGG